ncbi:MAG: hypothetical protein V1753_10930 [Pseudomonadota bacterium]
MAPEDMEFLQIVSVVTAQLGCTIENIDGTTISINCPGGREQEARCAMAIEEIMDNRG